VRDFDPGPVAIGLSSLECIRSKVISKLRSHCGDTGLLKETRHTDWKKNFISFVSLF
jgi:hypothetical protein